MSSVEREIREKKSHLAISTAAHRSQCQLHIPAIRGGTICSRILQGTRSDWREIEPAVYPPSHKGICDECKQRFQGEHKDEIDGSEDAAKSFLDSVRWWDDE